jgi:hypothetical protein
VAAYTDCFDTRNSWDKPLKNFRGCASNCLPVSADFASGKTCRLCSHFFLNKKPFSKRGNFGQAFVDLQETETPGYGL